MYATTSARVGPARAVAILAIIAAYVRTVVTIASPKMTVIAAPVVRG